MDKRTRFIPLNRLRTTPDRTRATTGTPRTSLIGSPRGLTASADNVVDTAVDIEPFTLERLDDRHATLAVPPNWQLPALLALVTEGPLGVGAGWFEGGLLHLTGLGAAATLRRLVDALLVLHELGVGEAPGPGVLDVLAQVPSLMTAPDGGLRLQGVGDAVQLRADGQWAQTALVDLAACSPRLACRFLRLLTPRLQGLLVRHCPSAVRTALARAVEADDRRQWTDWLCTGLRRAGRSPRPADDLAGWIGCCPPWAAAALHAQWQAVSADGVGTWWLRESPPLAQAVALLADAADAQAHPADRLPRVRPTWGSLTVEPDQPPPQVLAALRLHAEPPEGSLWWGLGIGFIRRQAAQILGGEADHPQGCLGCYQDVVEAARLLRKDGTAALRLHAVCSEVAALYALKRVDDQRLAWLLGQLYRNAQASFAAAAGHAFQRFCAAPASSRLCLAADADGVHAQVDLDDNVHLRWLLAALVLTTCADPAFQAQLPLNALKLLQELLGPLDPPLLQRLAPDGLPRASWRVQYLWRGHLARDDQDLPHTSQVFATIVRAAVHDEHPIRPAEINELAAQLAAARPHEDLIAWTALLFGAFPADQACQQALAMMVVNAASRLLDGPPDRWPWAHRYLALLCRTESVRIDRVREARPHATSARLFQTETLIRVQRLLAARADRRAQQRACAWLAQLMLSLGTLATDDTRDLAAYLFDRLHQGGLDQLNAAERGAVATYLGSHRPADGRLSYT